MLHVLHAFLTALLEGALEGLGLGGLGAFLADPTRATWNEMVRPYKDWVQDLVDNVVHPVYKEALERVKDLAEAVKATGDVFQEIGETIGEILHSGEVPARGDGGLGEVRDNFTPDGEIPTDFGELPGFDSPGTGLDRGTGGGGSGYGGGPGGGSGGIGSPTGSPPSTDPPAGDSAGAPTPEDLGLDPDSGAYVEYQPGEGQVVIHHPDGTTEVRPWP